MDIDPQRLDYIIRTFFRTQRSFAQAVGVHESAVSKWVKGERGIDDASLEAILEAGISVDFLAGKSSDYFARNLNGDARRKQYDEETKMIEDRFPTLARSNRSESQPSGHATWRSAKVNKTSLSPELDRLTIDQPTDADVVIPMLESSIPAGYKVPIYEDLATSFNVTTYYKNCFTMRVRGDSMIDAGIQDGDRVVIKRGHRFRNGDVIAAVVDGEITLKGVWTEDDKIRLVPANEKYPIYEVPEVSSFECLGVCIDTFRPPKKVPKR